MGGTTDLADFFGEVKGQKKPRQALTPKQVRDTAEDANDKFSNFLKGCLQKISGLTDAYVGPIKQDDVAGKKADRDYLGDRSFVCDIVRGKIVVNTPQQVLLLKQILDDPSNGLLHEHGMFVVHCTDFFGDPKEPTGYRALNYRIAVPVEGGHQLVELQVVAEQIEAVYDHTHPHKRAIERIYNDAIEKKPQIDDKDVVTTDKHGEPVFMLVQRALNKAEKAEVSYHIAKLALINGLAAREYHCLINPSLASKYEMTETRERKLLGRVNSYENIDYL